MIYCLNLHIVDGEVTSANTQSDNSKVNESEVKVKESNVKVKECEGNVKVDASEDNIKFKESEGKVNEGNVKVKECESNVTVNESQSVNEPNTAPVVKDPEMPKKREFLCCQQPRLLVKYKTSVGLQLRALFQCSQ